MKILAVLLAFLIPLFLFSQPCLPEGITFTSQAQIDSFQVNYPGCTEVEGNVTINEWSNITNLDGLNVITSVGGYLNIYNNNSLINLNGLENIISIGNDLRIQENDMLNSLFGLQNLTTIGADLNIGGNNTLQSLSGLSSLSNIDSNIYIVNNSAITNFNGLDSLTSIGGSLFILDNQSLIDFSGLENLVEIGGGFHIGDYSGDFTIGNQSLTSLSGLEGLTTIGGQLWIMWNEVLNNISGLCGLNSVGGDLVILANNSLASLYGLEELNFAGGDLKISSNTTLASLWGLENLNFASISSLSINNNSLLSICDIPNLCSYLDTLNTTITIYGNNSGCNNPSEVAEACGIEFSCLPHGDYYFVDQTDIDSFPSDYPNCKHLEGSTFIRGDNITNLNGLSKVAQIGNGGFHIQNNKILLNLIGLDSLETIVGDLIIGGEYPLNSNDSLVNLIGVNLLKTIGGKLYIGYNLNLTTLTGLEVLDSIGGSLIMVRNNNLSDITMLSHLAHIGGDLVVGGWLPYQGNFSLQSLSGLENIAANSIENLVIGNNTILSKCDVLSICDYLVAPGGNIDIFNNTLGCNSPEEVEENCAVSAGENYLLTNLKIHPNPFTTSTTIEYTLNSRQTGTITFYDSYGRKVEQITKHQLQGNQKVVWTPEGLSEGIYYLKIEAGKQIASVKVVLMR